MVGFHNYSEYSPSAITISADFAAIPHCSEIFLDKNRYNADFSKKFCTIVNFVPQYVDFSKKFRTPVNFAPHYKNRLVRFFFALCCFVFPPPPTTLGKYSLYVAKKYNFTIPLYFIVSQAPTFLLYQSIIISIFLLHCALRVCCWCE